ncbi:MAG: 3-isopropylmalate dehydratase large subunit [Acidobacteria bacterium]|jgi:3-isopropylmalate/(R)-2-methylmalate dehydratase large subunit|nr:3-isopropylmalate dehydratase large subunit [Acidobacteriota bacterium]
MGMTLVEKIFANRLGISRIFPGQVVFAPVDLIIGTDVTVPLSVKIFKEMDVEKVFDASKIVFINDHFVPAKDIDSANLARSMRLFAREQSIVHYYELGRCGICHITVPEKGLVLPGDIVVGADSHTCTLGALGAFATGIGSTDMAVAWATGELWFKIPETIQITLTGTPGKYISGKDIILYIIEKLGPFGGHYSVLEFNGPAVRKLPMSDRFTLCNMAVECGAKSGIITADQVTRQFLLERTTKEGIFFEADEDAQYKWRLNIDLSDISPMVASPYEPTDVSPVQKFEGIKLQQIVIGSCTNGRIEDFRIAGEILKGKKIHDSIRLIIIPGSPNVLKQMASENILNIFIDAGALIGPPTCGPCIGGHMGVLGDEEVGLYTTNRNFIGRNGAKSSKVYLCSPAVAAFSAIEGKITSCY